MFIKEGIAIPWWKAMSSFGEKVILDIFISPMFDQVFNIIYLVGRRCNITNWHLHIGSL